MELGTSLILIISTFLITALLFLIYNRFLLKRGTIFNFEKPDKETDTRIDWGVASDWRNQYLNFKPLQVSHLPADQKSGTKKTTQSLTGFAFSAADLKEIITDNHSGRTPDKVVFFIGQDGKTGKPWHIKGQQGNIRLIAVGMQEHQLLTNMVYPDDAVSRLPSIFDHADPCPPYVIEDSVSL